MSDVEVCPSCGKQVSEGANFCENCGVHLASGYERAERFSSERLDSQRRERVMLLVIIVLIIVILALLAYPSLF